MSVGTSFSAVSAAASLKLPLAQAHRRRVAPFSAVSAAASLKPAATTVSQQGAFRRFPRYRPRPH